MMRRTTRRRRGRTSGPGLLLLALVGLVGLSAMGMVFASWADDVAVQGTVSTGSVQAGIYDYASWDPGPNYLEPGGAINPVNSPYDGTADNQVVLRKSAAWQNLVPTGAAAMLPLLLRRVEPAFIQITNTASTHSINLGSQLFSVPEVMGMSSLPFYDSVREEFCNVYASYATGTTLVFGNGGTLPLHVHGMTLVHVSDPSGALDYAMVDHWDAFLWQGDEIVASWGEAYPPLTMPTLEEFLADWPYEGPIQLEPGQVLELGVAVIFAEPAEEDEFPEGANAYVEFGVAASLWCEGG